jgi:predicted nucleotidyltransferase component of viral defense system
MSNHYPDSFQEISIWAKESHVSVTEARQRYAQYGILQSIAGSNVLRNALVFKGGNALDFVWLPNRSTLDLDFSSRDADLTTDRIREFFQPSLQRISTSTGTLYALQRVRQQPPGLGRSFITFDISIGYALIDDSRNQERIKRRSPSLASIPVEISLNEAICAEETIELGHGYSLQVSTAEDIVAEKLRALLQQTPRNRTRPQDVLDIAAALHRGTTLNLNRIADFLKQKSLARNVSVSHDAFMAEDLWKRAEEGYADLASTARNLFIPFESAKELVLQLVNRLEL